MQDCFAKNSVWVSALACVVYVHMCIRVMYVFCVCIHVCMYVCVHVHICTWQLWQICVWVCRLFTHVWVCDMYVCIRTSMSMFMCVCVCVSVHVFVFMFVRHIYIRVFLLTSCTSTYIQWILRMHMYICMHTYMHTDIHMHIHTYMCCSSRHLLFGNKKPSEASDWHNETIDTVVCVGPLSVCLRRHQIGTTRRLILSCVSVRCLSVCLRKDAIGMMRQLVDACLSVCLSASGGI
jgi:hypothetical protein